MLYTSKERIFHVEFKFKIIDSVSAQIMVDLHSQSDTILWTDTKIARFIFLR